MLKANRLYRVECQYETLYAYAVDGEGVIWFDSLSEAREETGISQYTNITEEAFEAARYGEEY